MADLLPPAPIDEPPRSYAWVDYYEKMVTKINQINNLSWSSVNKTGSSLADLQTRLHNSLQTIQGGTTNEYYHLTQTQHSHIGQVAVTTSTSYPIADAIPEGYGLIWHHSDLGVTRLYTKISGTLKYVVLS